MSKFLNLFSDRYQDFYGRQGPEEKQAVFIHANHLPEQFSKQKQNITVAELGFGTGLTFALTALAHARHAPAGSTLTYISAEAHPISTQDIEDIHQSLPESLHKILAQARALWPLRAGWNTLRTSAFTLHLWHGDALQMFEKQEKSTESPTPHWQAEAWFLDGFSPAKNPAMWSEPLMKQIFSRTASGGTFSTYTAAGEVRRTLQAVGFVVEKVKGHGPKRHMTIGHKLA